MFDAFNVGAFQYLLKPVDEEKFARVFACAVEQIMFCRENPQRGRVLTIQSGNTSKTIPLDSICYIEGNHSRRNQDQRHAGSAGRPPSRAGGR